MPDPSYYIENMKRAEALSLHLSANFYPPIPSEVKEAFVSVFQKYWGGELSVEELPNKLESDAWYSGGLGQYNFWQFLNEEDLEEH